MIMGIKKHIRDIELSIILNFIVNSITSNLFAMIEIAGLGIILNIQLMN